MNFGQAWKRLGHHFATTPMVAVSTAVALLAVSLALGLYNDSLRKTENLRRATVQAQILAASLAAPLAFDDVSAAQEYVNALQANPEVEAVGAYNGKGKLVAGYARVGQLLPENNQLAAPLVRGANVALTAAVEQGGIQLGSVYLRFAAEPLRQRMLRYVGIGIVILMASLLVAGLGSSYATIREAHQKLQQEIEDREKAEEALRQAQKMEAMGQLTGGVAHDFNNLLMIASSGLDLLERTTDPQRRERLKHGVRQAIDRGARLTQQLLAFARRTPLKPQVIDLGECLQEMRDMLERSLREDIMIEFEAKPGLWPVEIDPSQLEVAVLNIALNARDAMPSGGVISMRVENVPAGGDHASDMVRLTIADTGTGMPQAMLHRVFEPFFTTKAVGKGTGLGLSQVYGFARASGGDVQIDSEEGQGTRVSMLLPRSRSALPKAPPQAPAIAATSAQHRVLLVEDDNNVADLVTEMLTELGYSASRVGNAAGALNVLRTDSRFDLVLSDMVMPGEMDGLGLAEEIAKSWPNLPVILTTGYSAAAAAAIAKGMRLLVKPYRLETLSAELQNALTVQRTGAHG